MIKGKTMIRSFISITILSISMIQMVHADDKALTDAEAIELGMTEVFDTKGVDNSLQFSFKDSHLDK
jgi:hypothetical protein